MRFPISTVSSIGRLACRLKCMEDVGGAHGGAQEQTLYYTIRYDTIEEFNV